MTSSSLTALDRPISGDGVQFHADPQRRDITLPLGLTYDDAITALMRHKEAMETYVETSPRYFSYLLDDGLVAAAHCLDQAFGISFSSRSLSLRALRFRLGR